MSKSQEIKKSEQFNYKNLSPFKWFVLENFPFIEEDFDALTEYELYCKIVEYLNKVIASTNELGGQVETVTNALITLENYVDNYFKNLDVQDEINNKLNDMANDGTLAEIINQEIFGQINTDITNLENEINNIFNFENNKLNFMLLNNQNPTLLFAGDSITYGTGATNNFPDLIKNYIIKEYNITPICYNEGIEGAMSIIANNNFNNYKNKNPDIIFWEYGINDANNNKEPSYTANNLINFYKLCKQNNIELIVILPNIINKSRLSDLLSTNYKMEQLYLLLKKTCEKLGLIYIDIYEELDLMFKSNAEFVLSIMPDGTHFSDYNFHKNVILKTLLSSIKKLNNSLNANICPINFNGDYMSTNGINSGLDTLYSLGNVMKLDNTTNFKYVFYNSSPILLDFVVYDRNDTGSVTFLIDEEEFTFSTYNENNVVQTNLFNNKNRYSNLIKPGIHIIKLSKFNDSRPKLYLEGFIFTKKTDYKLLEVNSHILWRGNISRGENISFLKNKIDKTGRVILIFYLSGYYQFVHVPILDNTNEFGFAFNISDNNNNITQVRCRFNYNTNTFTLANNTQAVLRYILEDNGNQFTPYNF